MIVYLIGFSGTGKSTIVRILRNIEKEHLLLADIDEEISYRFGMPVEQIFDELGEEAFRKAEKVVLAGIAENYYGECDAVVSCGGGIVLDPENVELMKRSGKIVWLDASADVIFGRIGAQKTRPLLSGKDVSDIEAMKKERDCLYKNIADEVINTDYKPIGEVVGDVLNKLAR